MSLSMMGSIENSLAVISQMIAAEQQPEFEQQKEFIVKKYHSDVKIAKQQLLRKLFQTLYAENLKDLQRDVAKLIVVQNLDISAEYHDRWELLQILWKAVYPEVEDDDFSFLFNNWLYATKFSKYQKTYLEL